MIKIENLSKKYGVLTAVDGLTLNINKGETFALLGLNGAGKSTTINILCSLIRKDSGIVSVGGYDLDKENEKVKSVINLSPQETAVALNLTVQENLDFICGLYGVEDAEDKCNEIIERFSLSNKVNSLAKNLSGGQKRRLSLAMAVITEPKVLILDEPTLGLDVKSRNELWKIIRELKGEVTVLITTHYLEEAVNLADRIGVMSNGKLVIDGTAQEIIAKSGKQNFEDAFLSLCGGNDD